MIMHKRPPGLPFTAHDERLLNAVTVHTGHALSKLGPELALDEGRVPRAVPCWRLSGPLRIAVNAAANVSVERRRTLLGYSSARFLSVQVELFHGETRLAEPLLTPGETPLALFRFKESRGESNASAASGANFNSGFAGPAGDYNDDDGDGSGGGGGDGRRMIDAMYGVPADYAGSGGGGDDWNTANAAAGGGAGGGRARAGTDSLKTSSSSASNSGVVTAATATTTTATDGKKYARANAEFKGAAAAWMPAALSVRNAPRATRVIFTLLGMCAEL